jgi:hypothetical protein
MSASRSNVSRASLLGAVLAIALPVLAHADSTHATGAAAPVSKAAATQDAMRDLWIGHIFWVRNVVSDTLAGSDAAASASEKEVVANAKAIAAAIEPFYGHAANEKLFGLLAGHYGAIKDYLKATKAGDAAGQKTALGKLTSNANDISVFLSGANPNLPVDTLRGLLTAHGAHHVQQIQQLKAGQYAEEAKTWDAMKNHMYVVADALTNAIAKQFPEKFS